MSYKYLPPNNEGKLYSPQGVRQLLQDAVNSESGNIQAIFDNPNKFKTLIELWYASALAVVVYKRMGRKFFMYPSDSPDVHFVQKIDKLEQEGFSVEIMTLFNYGQDIFDSDYQKLAKQVWNTKGEKDYDRTELLLVSRLNGSFNVDEFARQLSKFPWKFLRIWLSIHRAKDSTWTVFDLYSSDGSKSAGHETVNISDLPY